MLPNERLGNRRIEDLLKEQYTGHIAVEWIQDGEDKNRFLCTGFCFNSGRDGGLRYYNYLFEYRKGSEMNIESLPFTHVDEEGRRRTTSYHKLKDQLKQMGIMVLDKINVINKL